MSKENVQWLVLALVMVGLVGVGASTFHQGLRLAKISNALVALDSKIENSIQPLNANQPSLKADENGSNVLDPRKHKPGDVIAGLKLISIGAVPGMSRQVDADNLDAQFFGKVTLSGTYDYSANAFVGEDMVCFMPDLAERSKLPVLVGEPEQNSRFCFSNLEKAKQAFGPAYGHGQATVTIDNYDLLYAPAEVFNRAELINVVSKLPL